MDKSRDEFIVFLHEAMHDHHSPAYQELYEFLVNCFVHADTNMEGKITLDKMDSLVNESAVLPRKLGLAPKNEDIYATEAIRKDARAKLFNVISATGYITLEKWLSWATEHIAAKTGTLPKDYLGGNSRDVTKEDFVAFIKKASQKGTPEYRQLYFFLLKCFQAGDVHHNGTVDLMAFDKMVEKAAFAPRRFGLAPKTVDIFPTEAARIAKRKEYFKAMDKEGKGVITFNDWLDYAFVHIVEKVATL
jgi:Ca2+-binding EF-hand superfamily protein